jgi:hypothetical protein
MITRNKWFKLKSNFNHQIQILYNKNLFCDLAKLFEYHGSDKGINNVGQEIYPWQAHSYSDFYSSKYWHCRDSVKYVFECGIGTNNVELSGNMGLNGKPGASLRAWRDYFQNAIIYGADIDTDILFEEERIKTFYLNQLDTNSIIQFWNDVKIDKFDLMIDDGMHTFEAATNLFINSISRLSSNGFYMIEDVLTIDLPRYKIFFDNKKYHVEYIRFISPKNSLHDSNIISIRKNEQN